MREITKQRIGKILENAIADGTTAGANLLVIKNDKEIFYTEKGFADVEQQKAMKRDTIFRLYSMTKPVTATAAMILMEWGELELGQPVGDFLPEFLTEMTRQRQGAAQPVIWKNV